MAQLGPVVWPPGPIKTERLVIRASEARDRAAVIDLFSSPEVGAHIGGPQMRDDLESVLPHVPGQRPGFFAVELAGAMIGIATVDRRDITRPGHVRSNFAAAELGYMLLPHAWGFGYATEACGAVLEWFADAVPGEPVVLSAQTANAPSVRVAMKLGFTELERFVEYDAEHWFGVWMSPAR